MSFLKSIWKTNSKHKKLSEELALQNAKEIEAQQPGNPESDSDVVTFKLKYLGSTVVEKVSGDNISTESVKNIIKVAKASRKKLVRVNVAISLKGIVVTDVQGNDMFKVSIYRISNCATNQVHRQVFSFISTDVNETMECHAFWCPKRKVAELVALTVARAFTTAYEAWRVSPKTKDFEGMIKTEDMKNVLNTMQNNLIGSEDAIETLSGDDKNDHMVEEKLIDFDDDPVNEVNVDISYKISKPENGKHHWVCFDDDFENQTQRWNTTKIDLMCA